MSTDLAQLAADPGALEAVRDPGEYVILACERAKTWLSQALDHGDIDQIVEVKSQAEAIRVYTAQKQMGHDAELAAAEVVRRAERGIGLAIRKGQEAGVIARPGENPFTGNQHVQGEQRDAMPSTKVLPGDIVPLHERSAAYAVTDGVSDDQFDEAVAEAKDEQNLSRANVVRKVRAKREATEVKDAVLANDDDPDWVPDGQDKSRKAVERRREIIRDRADKGWTSHQIAGYLGVRKNLIWKVTRDEGITVVADKVVGKRRRIDPNRVVDGIVTAAELTDTELTLIDFEALDRDLIPEWVSSLTESLKRLRRLKNDLERELNRGQR